MESTAKGCGAAIATAAAVVTLVVCGLGVAWIAQGNEFFLAKVFSPLNEDVRRETFEHSRAYREGMRQELENMRFEYAKADDAHKDSLASVILHRTADVDLMTMPADLRAFIQGLKRDRLDGK